MDISNKKGLIMAVIGFLMLLFNAVNYIFGLDYRSPAITVLGLVFVTIGMKMKTSGK